MDVLSCSEFPSVTVLNFGAIASYYLLTTILKYTLTFTHVRFTKTAVLNKVAFITKKVLMIYHLFYRVNQILIRDSKMYTDRKVRKFIFTIIIKTDRKTTSKINTSSGRSN